MGTQDDDLRDRPEPGQATPRTTAQDAGGNEGGSLSATRLLRSLGKFVGLGSDVPSPVPSDPARLDTTLGTASAPAAGSTDSSSGSNQVGVVPVAPPAPPVEDPADVAAAREATEFLARAVTDSLAKHQVASRDVNDTMPQHVALA